MTRRRIDTHRFRNITVYSVLIGIFAWAPILFCADALQRLVKVVGIPCHVAWTIMEIISVIGAAILPFIFARYIRKKYEDIDKVHRGFMAFNFFEYAFLEIGLLIFFISNNNLCYVGDGQTAMAFGFSGWLSIPIIYVVNRVLESILKRKLKPNQKISSETQN